MTFSLAQYNAAIEKVQQKNAEIGPKIGEVRTAANSTLNNAVVPGFVKEAVEWCVQKISELATQLWEKITECLKGMSMPIYMFKYAWDWQDVRGLSTDVAGQLKPEALGVDERWQGSAATAYGKAIPVQNAAAAKVGTIADRTAMALTVCAGAGLAFYVALGIILVKFISAMIAAIAALGSAVFSWAGAALIVEEAGVDSGLIIAAVTALGAALGAQASQMSALHGEATDNSAFPGGKWPDPTKAGDYSDATVKDGDVDWSIKL